MILKALYIVLFLPVIYLVLGVSTIIKNGTSITDNPGTLSRLKTFLSSNTASTAPNHDYPELITREYVLSKKELEDKVIEVAKKLDYSLETQSGDEIHLIVTTKLVKYKDDVKVTITDSEKGSTLNMSSQSRKGRADFGANIANITRLIKAIDTSLTIEESGKL